MVLGVSAAVPAASTALHIVPTTPNQIAAAVRAPGAKATLVNVWATFCGPCRKEFPELVRLQRTWKPKGLRVMFVSADTDDQKAAVLIQESLAKIGIQVTIQKMLTAAYAARQFNQRDMPMFFWDWISFVNDPYYGFTFLSQCKQGTNYANFCNKQVDALIPQGMYAKNPARRAAISVQLQRLVAQGATDIGLGTPDNVVVMQKSIRGWFEQPDLNARYYTLSKS